MIGSLFIKTFSRYCRSTYVKNNAYHALHTFSDHCNVEELIAAGIEQRGKMA